VSSPHITAQDNQEPYPFPSVVGEQDSPQSLEQQLKFETFISELTAKVIDAAPDTMNETLTETLQTIASFLNLDACFLFDFSEQQGRLTATHASDPPPQSGSLTDLSVLLSSEQRKRFLNGDSLTLEFAPTQVTKETGAVCSERHAPPQMLVIPSWVENSSRGALGFLVSDQNIEWHANVENRLKLLGSVIANTRLREQTAQELSAAKTRYSLAVAGSTDGIWDWDVTTRELFFSERCFELLGYQPGEFEVSSETAYKLIHPDDLVQAKTALKRHLTEKVPYDVEYRLLANSGEYRWFRTRGQAIWDEAGDPLRMAGSIQDIDDRKRAEAALINAAGEVALLDGLDFFQSAALQLAKSLGADYVVLGTFIGNPAKVVLTSAFVIDGKLIDNMPYDLAGTPCETLLTRPQLLVPKSLQDNFPNDRELKEMDAEAYAGVAIYDTEARPTGLVSLIFRRALAETQVIEATLKIFSSRIAAEFQRNQAAHDLQRSERKVSRIFDLGLIGMAITSPLKSWSDVNQRLCEITGYSREELLNLSLPEMIHPNDLKKEVAHHNRVLAGEIDAYTMEMRLLRKNGEIMHASISVNCSRNSEGVIESFSILIQDITKRKQMEYALRATVAQYRAIVDTSPACVKLQTPDGTILDINKSGLSLVEADILEQVQERNVFELIVPEYHEAYRNFVQRVCEGERGLVQYEIVGLRGTRRFMESRAVQLPTNDDRTVLVCITNDITVRKEEEQLRDQLIGELEAKNAELERFTYTVSHDLKSPLVTIKGFLDLLESDLATGDQSAVEDDMAEINRAAETMAHQLDGLLDLSRIGRVANCSENVPLADVTELALQKLSGVIAEKGVQVTVREGLPQVRGDRMRLADLMQNLIENAVKFCAPEDPQIEIGHKQIDGETVCFVWNNGTGIDPAYHERVFMLFERLDTRDRGTGIGLTIVKAIVNAHQGDIWIESKGKDDGCRFVFKLPLGNESAL